MIRSIYGSCGGLDLESGEIHSLKPTTWRNIILAGTHIQEIGINFKQSFKISVSSDSELEFWNSSWLNGSKLRDMFPRLYRLEPSSAVKIKDRIAVTDAGNSIAGDWIRIPSGRTGGELLELTDLIAGYEFVEHGKDKCVWTESHDGILTVRSLSLLIDNLLLASNINISETMRNKLVPKKLEVFVWRTCKRRLPVLVEIDKRGIDLHSVRCPLCDEEVESVEHSIIFCKYAMEVWDRVFSWWGFGSMSNLSITEILRGNGPTSSTTFGKKIWQAVEWVCAYQIWRNRNEKVFRGKTCNSSVIFNEVQVKTFEWIAKRSRKRKIEWSTLINDPGVYLTLA